MLFGDSLDVVLELEQLRKIPYPHGGGPFVELDHCCFQSERGKIDIGQPIDKNGLSDSLKIAPKKKDVSPNDRRRFVIETERSQMGMEVEIGSCLGIGFSDFFQRKIELVDQISPIQMDCPRTTAMMEWFASIS